MRFVVTFMVGDTVHHTMTVDWGTALSAQTMYFVDLTTFAILDIDFEGEVFEDIALSFANPVGAFNRLTFVVNGIETAQLLPHDYALDNLFTPAPNDDHIFVGWYHDSDFSRPVLASDRLTGHTTIYARFEPAPPTTFWQSVSRWSARNWGIILIVGIVVAFFAVCLFGGSQKRKRYGRR